MHQTPDPIIPLNFSSFQLHGGLMERQILFRGIQPTKEVLNVIEQYIDRHMEKFEHFSRPVGTLHVELLRDASDFVCQLWGHFGRGDVVVKKKNDSIIGATVGAMKALEMRLRKSHHTKVMSRKHGKRRERINKAGVTNEPDEMGAEFESNRDFDTATTPQFA
jgi:ribosome-associated translation inhibitor RaiA